MPFSSLPAAVAESLAARGYAEPTPVQAAVLEAEAAGRDLLVSAQTGSGKTVAFGVAMASDLLGDGVPPASAPLALAIAPTRELALQVSRELAWLYEKAGLRIATCVGGMDPSKERRQLNHGAHIVVGTPGRLRDHLERGALDLSALRFVVLDEADEMLDMGFREDLEELLDATPAQRRTLLFSATMPRPIAVLAKQYQRDALRISTIDDRQGHGDISYQAVAVSPNDIENAVINLLRFHEAETAMLFCATRDNVRRLHATLVERGFAAVALSGEHSQNERNQAIQALRDGRARICVATDVAARGIDIPSLSLVVHVEVPRDAETLQHRSGRTGRAGRKGTAVLVVPYPRRRRLEEMLRRARIEAEWMPAPGAAQIRERDRERLLEKLLAPVDAEDVLEDDVALADTLMERMEVRDIALALVRSYRSAMPQPEDLIDLSTEEGRKATHRTGFDDVSWFRMDIGRRQNADPRWLLPLLCRRGHITRNEIGAIRIGPSETYFQVPKAMEDRFRAALQRTAREGAEDETGIRIEPSEPPREMARTNRRQGNGPNRPREGFPPRGDGPRSDGPRPHRKGPPRRREG
ncbi:MULTISPECIES: DEAD/DEAH box helicase [unclassified Novosphingobium]|uniref:DEAD/DEAH box helicase n=1 Tax=unclassified Novosphingobium TaxID=2644732 RepID=UPI000D2F9FB0|nr:MULTISPECIES: DEAD/DEAH box helicase [unclassified Novosphingobium]PTR07799.1 ATP-dependent RNA helicase DeaD [Novosphingobium sp. GV055]PUB00612.1 ATP-dependent RNA helicase DeaD [Novosphingobium sp. GV061]PUB16021.1 ATP-dependent RNA helicase DeaD [Novosphingobium sp. GV079]PUB39486.1 ATP-dependent RNA helicase DeaD [Novosphingobium sp. GV027]